MAVQETWAIADGSNWEWCTPVNSMHGRELQSKYDGHIFMSKIEQTFENLVYKQCAIGYQWEAMTLRPWVHWSLKYAGLSGGRWASIKTLKRPFINWISGNFWALIQSPIDPGSGYIILYYIILPLFATYCGFWCKQYVNLFVSNVVVDLETVDI